MKKKLAVMGVVALILSVSMQPAFASTSYSPTRIYLDGQNITNPVHTTAIDPSSKQPTTFMPIYYAEQVLTKLGIQSTWDGAEWSFTAPSTIKPDLNSPSVSPNQMSIAINGTTVQTAPKVVAVDPASGQQTTFIPIFYLSEVLGRVGITSAWDGTNWHLTSQDGTATQILDSITWTDANGYRTFSAPIYPEKATWNLTIGMADVTTHKSVPVQVSTDGGKTWSTAPANYDSYDPTQGGVVSVPVGITHVLVRGPINDMAGVSFGAIGKTSSTPIADMIVMPDGSKTIKFILQGGVQQ